MSKVSAVITTFNRGHFVGAAIQSVLDQTLKDFELIILDNSSIDDTEQVVKMFADDRIRYVKHKAMNISPQRNLGVQLAKAPFISFLDDDDVWKPNKLEDELDVIESEGQDIVLAYGGYSFFNETGEYEFHRPRLKGHVLRALLMEEDGFCASASNPMMRIQSIKDVGGYDETVESGEDYHLYLKLARLGRMNFTPNVVVSIRQHDGPRLIDRLDARIFLEEKIVKEFSSEMDNHVLQRYFKKIGGKYIREGDYPQGRKYLRSAIAIKPTDLQALTQLVVSFAGRNIYSACHRFITRQRTRNYSTYVSK